jgi:hypothetical protein
MSFSWMLLLGFALGRSGFWGGYDFNFSKAGN